MSEGGYIAASLFLQKMIDQSRDLMGIIGEDGKFIQINVASKGILGYRPEELEGRSLLDVVHKEDQFISQLAINEAVKKDEKIHLINRLVHRDKKIVFLDWTMEWDNEDFLIYVVGRPVQESESNLNALQTAKEAYLRIFYESPFPVLIWDAETQKVVECNKEVLKKYGYTRDEFLQLHVRDIRNNEDAPGANNYKEDGELIEDGHIWTHKRGDAEILHMSIKSRAINFRGRRCVLSYLHDVTVRTEAEKELLKLHRRFSDYKFALDESSIVSITDSRGIITHVNDYFCLLSKYSRDELIGRNHNIVNSNYHDPAFFGNLWKTILNGQVWRGVIRNRAKDGSFYWVDNTIVPFLDENGRPYQFMAVRIDISEQKRAEERILMKSRLLSATTQVVSTLFQYEDWEEALDKSFEIVGSTTSADNIYYFANYSDGYGGEQVLRQEYLWTQADGFSGSDKASSKEFILNELSEYQEELRQNKSVLLDLKEVENDRVKNVLKGKGVQSLILVPVFVKKRLYGLLGIESYSKEKQWKTDEISFLHTLASKLSSALEKRKGFVELQIALQEKNTILESIGDGFIALNRDWTVSYCNNRAESILCIQREDIIGRKFLEIFSEQLPSSIPLNCQKAIEGETIVHFEEYFPILKAWLDITLNPSPPGLSMFFKDVTERKAHEEKLKKINRELALSNSELEQFAFVASHDLQEPLRMITSFLAQIEKKYQDLLDEKGKKYIYFARDGAKRMRNIILDLLEFSRVGRSDEDKEYVDIGLLLEDIVTLSHKVIKEKNAVINWDQNFPVVYTFKSPLRLVFQNLIGNALKYQKEDTTPILNITCDESDETEWHFIVSDNGIGIEREYFEKIFVIFQRLHYKSEFSGTGVGLAICKKIIETLGGKIWVVSEFGKGSDFHFSFPKHEGMKNGII